MANAIDYDDMSRDEKIQYLIAGEVVASRWLVSADSRNEGFKPQVCGLNIGTTYYPARGAAIAAGKEWLNKLQEEANSTTALEQQ